MRIILFLAVLFVFSCKNDTAQTELDGDVSVETLKQEKGTQEAIAAPKKTKHNPSLPDVCNLVTDEFVAKAMNIPANTILVNPVSNKFERACFFKWDEDEVANAGAMVQVAVNPVVDEVPNYFEMLMTGKRVSGEQDVLSDAPVKYKDFKGYGNDGVYSYELGKYHFRLGNDYGFLVAFNSGMSEQEQMRVAKLLANELLTKFQALD